MRTGHFQRETPGQWIALSDSPRGMELDGALLVGSLLLAPRFVGAYGLTLMVSAHSSPSWAPSR